MRNIPTLTKNLLIINVLAYAAGLAVQRYVDLNDIMGLHFMLAPDFRVWQLVTYLFMHGGFHHLFFNMFALWMFGCIVENTMGTRRYALYYLACGIGAGLFQEAAQLVQFYTIAESSIEGFSPSDLLAVAHANAPALGTWTTVGASGAVYGILLAFGMSYPDERIFIFPLPLPIKAKWIVIGYAAIEVYMAMTASGDDVAHLAHLGGMAVGYMLMRYWRSSATRMRRQRQQFNFFGGKRGTWTRGSGSQADGRDAAQSADWDYNARRKEAQETTDRILDKIRRSGYDSLTAEEKKHLFDQSNRK